MSASLLPVAILGGQGRMGQAVIAALEGHPRLGFSASVEADQHVLALEGCAVAIDFTTPSASVFYATEAARRALPLVIGTTGLSAEQQEVISQAARQIPIVQAANMSVGVTLLAILVEQAAAGLGPEYDIEILEMHHRNKLDAPSGTALMLGHAAAAGRARELPEIEVRNRIGGETQKRASGEIGFASLRGGDVAGDHTVYFAGDGERLELTHRASSRAVFAQGAVRAAEWVIDQPPGLYSMRNVLGFA